MPRRLDADRLRSLAAQLLPPLVVRLLRRRRPDFSGTHERFADVPDEDPWGGDYWLTISRRKLEQVRQSPRRTVPAGVHGCHALPTLVVNQICARRHCRVLDFGGGTGFVYLAIRDALPANVSWHVVDSPGLAAMGREYAADDDRLSFSAEIPPETFDVLYLNTTLQYIAEPWALLERLLQSEPEACVLTRLIAGDVPEWVATQTIGGRRTPCRFLNLPELLDRFAERGYRPELLGAEDSYDGAYARSIPEHLRIPYDVNVVLRRAS